MAKKSVSLNDLFSEDRAPSWAREIRNERLAQEQQEQQRLERVNAILPIMEQEGYSQAAMQAAARQIMETGDFSVGDSPEMDTPAEVVLPTATPESMPQMSATTSESVLDSLPTRARDLAGDLGARFRAGAREGLAGIMTGAAPAINLANRLNPVGLAATALGVDTPEVGTPASLMNEAKRLREEAARIRGEEVSTRGQVADQVIGDAEGFTGVLGAYVRNPTVGLDALATQAGQMYSALPGAVAGPYGMVGTQALSAGGNAGDQAYQDVVSRGGTEEEANRAREVAAEISVGVNAVIPSITPRGTALEELISGATGRIASRSVTGAVTAPVVGEAASEMLTEVLDQAGQNYAVGRPISEGLGEAAAHGLALGVAMGGVPAATDARRTLQDRERRAAMNEEAILNNVQQTRNDVPVLPSADPATAPAQATTYGMDQVNVDRELFNVEQDIAQDEARATAYDDAFTRAEEESALQREVEEEAGFRTLDLQSNADGTLAEQFRSQGLATEITPEQVAQERIAQAQAQREQARLEQERSARQAAEEARVRQINDVARRREAVTKKMSEEAAKKQKAADTATRSQRNKAIDELVAENPTATDAQIADMLQERLAAPKAAAPKAPARQARSTKSEPTEVEKLEASADPVDKFAAEALKKLGLGMQSPIEPKAKADFATQARSLGRALAKDSSRQAAAVEQLLQQGKLVVAPSAESIGRPTQGRRAEYDTNDGTMYVYTDALSDSPVADILEAVSHESGHAGTFNQREGRDAVTRALVGDESTIAAASKLRSAASGGNRLAQAALTKAEADTTSRGGDATYEDAELVAYFIGDVAKSRTSALGTAGGAVRDIISGARSVLRDRLGMDVDISIGDLNTAASRVMEEIARTDITPTQGDSLGMIYNSSSAGFEQAVRDGNVYDSVDGRQKYVLSDADSTLTDNAADLLKNSRGPVKLRDILNHDVLYREHPEVADMDVFYVDTIPGSTAFAHYDPMDRSVTVTRRLVDAPVDPYSNAPNLRSGLMHEIQHYVQDVGDQSSQYYEGPTPRLRKADSDLKRAGRANDQAAATLLANAARMVTDRGAKREIADIVMMRDLSDSKKARSVAEIVMEQENISPQLQSFLTDYMNTRSEYNRVAQEYNAATQENHANYLANITEREAFFTQNNIDNAQDTLPVNPEGEMRTQERDVETGIDTTGGRIDVPQGDGTVVARGEDRSLGMNIPTGVEGRRFRNTKAGNIITSLFRNDKGLGDKVLQAVESARSAPAEWESKANRFSGRYDNALRKLAKSRGTTYGELNKEIEGKLEELYTMEGTPSEYMAKFNEIADQYGEAGKELKQLRDLNDELSREIVSTYLKSGGELTPNEAKEVKAILSNLGRYRHRFYASNRGKVGKGYSDAVMNAVERNSKGKKLSPQQEELLGRYQRAASFLADDLMIPDADGMPDLTADKVDYLYDQWITSKEDGITTDQKKDALLAKREQIDPERMANKIAATAENLLYGVEDTAATTYYNRGGKLDTGILKSRKRIPKEIRDLMGEVTDPAAALLVTASKQAELLARTNMLLELRSLAEPTDLQPADMGDSRIARDNRMTQLKGDQYGPLEGMYASPSLRSIIDETRETVQNFTDAVAQGSDGFSGPAQALARVAVDKWMRGAGRAKALSVVGNMFNYVGNLAGATMMPLFNGNLNPATYSRGLADAANLIGYARSPSRGLRSAADAVKYGIVDSATVGDLKLLDQGKLNQVVNEMSGKNPSFLWNVYKKGILTARETYAMMDVWAKIANFHNEVNHLTSLYKDAGIEKTADAINREAAGIISDTNIGWNRSLPLVKMLERGGLTQFGSYMYEVNRIQLTNILQGMKEIYRAKEMPTAAAKARTIARGTSRLMGQAASLAALNYLSNMASKIWGDDEEEEKDKRSLLPESSRISDLINVGKDSEGRPVLWAASNRLDPIGPVTDLIRASRVGDRPMEAVWKQFKENYITPGLAPQLWDAAARTRNAIGEEDAWPTFRNTPSKPLMQEWFPKGYGSALGLTGNDEVVQSWNNIAESLVVPGTMRAWTSRNPVVTTPPDGDSSAAMAYNVMRAMGARGVRVDPEAAAASAGYTYTNKMKDIRGELSTFLRNRPEATPEDVADKVNDLIKEEKKLFDNMSRVYRGMQAVGVSEQDTAKALKEAGVASEMLGIVQSGEFTSRAINKQSIENAAKRDISRAKTAKEREEKQAHWQAMWEILEEIEGAQ